MAILEVKNLVVNYGAIRALKGISFDVNEGEIISLIGSNGAGKTTTLHSISNLIKKQSGSVVFDGEDITNLQAAQIVHRGLIHVPEGRRIFANLSVKDNLEMGAYTRNDKEKIKQDMEHVFELFPRMKERLKQLAGTLSGGEQQMLAMGRGLMANPKLLLLDEPAAGMNPQETDELMNLISFIRKEFNLTILLIEHDMKLVMGICERLRVLDYGRVIASGNPDEIKANPQVIKAYLGSEAVNA